MELVVCKQLMQPQCQKWWFVIHRWYIIIIWNVTLLNCPASVDVVILSVLWFLWSCPVLPFPHAPSNRQKQKNAQDIVAFPVICVFFLLLCLHLWLLLFKSICSKTYTFTNIPNLFDSVSNTVFPSNCVAYTVYSIIKMQHLHVPDCHSFWLYKQQCS